MRVALLIVVSTVIGCATGAVPLRTVPSRAEDARAVELVLRRWYDASEKHDSIAYAAPLLPEFFIIEDTTRYDRPALVRLVVASFAAGTDRATLSGFKTVVDGDVAWTSFHNAEVFTPNGGTALPVRRYLETAVFRRVDGVWKIERYHATRINRAVTSP